MGKFRSSCRIFFSRHAAHPRTTATADCVHSPAKARNLRAPRQIGRYRRGRGTRAGRAWRDDAHTDAHHPDGRTGAPATIDAERDQERPSFGTKQSRSCPAPRRHLPTSAPNSDDVAFSATSCPFHLREQCSSPGGSRARCRRPPPRRRRSSTACAPMCGLNAFLAAQLCASASRIVHWTTLAMYAPRSDSNTRG